MPCPTGSNCGVVVADPTSGLGPGQYVYLNFYDFAPGDTGTTMYYCADPGGGTVLTAPPTCANENTSSFSEAEQQLGMFPASTSTLIPQGTSSASMQAEEVSSPSDPIAASKFNPTLAEPGFYCDGTAANACAVVITDASITPGHPTSTSLNSVVLPVTFASSSSGCPNGTVVSTESEFGIDLLMPTLAKLSCANVPSAAVVPLDVANDGLSAVTDLVAGTQQIAFTDDPESPDQQALLRKGGFALIPVALTANVVGFDAQIYSRSNFQRYNLGQVDLTPTMTAGLLTDAGNYPEASNTDDDDPCSGPSAGTTDTTGPCLSGPAPCFGGATCSLFLQLNYISGYTQFTTFQSVQRSDTAGATHQLFNWLCTAPKVPLDFGVHPTESASGAQELEVGLSPAAGPALTTCPADSDQVPAISGQQTLITVNDPSQQALKAEQAVQNGTGDGSTAAFTDMNWAESRYYGMNVAALQNAAGAFVTPTAASLNAALADATVNPDGSYTPRNLSSDAAAYPMPSVIYAVVPTTPTTAANASAVSSLLTQLLALTSGSETSALPDGFVPLPSNVAKVSAADIAKDIRAVAVTPTTTPTTKTTTPTGSTGTSDFNDAAFGSAFDSLDGINYISPVDLALTSLGGAAAGASATGAAVHHVVLPLLGPDLPGYALVASHGKVLVPVAMTVGIIAVVLGLAFMGTGVLRRRRARLGLATAGAAVEAEPEPADETS
jgi:hypothetical protein